MPLDTRAGDIRITRYEFAVEVAEKLESGEYSRISYELLTVHGSEYKDAIDTVIDCGYTEYVGKSRLGGLVYGYNVYYRKPKE